jgi:hypothetical protein
MSHQPGSSSRVRKSEDKCVKRLVLIWSPRGVSLAKKKSHFAILCLARLSLTKIPFYEVLSGTLSFHAFLKFITWSSSWNKAIYNFYGGFSIRTKKNYVHNSMQRLMLYSLFGKKKWRIHLNSSGPGERWTIKQKKSPYTVLHIQRI